jgi:hypothetical protein
MRGITTITAANWRWRAVTAKRANRDADAYYNLGHWPTGVSDPQYRARSGGIVLPPVSRAESNHVVAIAAWRSCSRKRSGRRAFDLAEKLVRDQPQSAGPRRAARLYESWRNRMRGCAQQASSRLNNPRVHASLGRER